MFYVYVLKSKKDEKLYIGYTNDLKRRIQEHNSVHTRSIKSRLPFTLVYYEAYHSLQDARIREERLKQFKNSYTELKKRIRHSLNEI